jgi:AcrR family transcriptional regulator
MPQALAKQGVRRARASLYRTLIVEAAERVFAARGYDDGKMQDIAAAAGLSLRTLYAIFPGKWEIFQAIGETRGHEVLERIAAATRDGGAALDRLLRAQAAYLEYMMAHPDYLRMHLREGTAWALGVSAHAGRAQLEAWARGMAAQVDLFRAGIGEGAFVDESPALLAKMLAAMHQVALADWVEGGMREPPDALIRRMEAQLCRSFCRPRARKG